MAYDSGNKTVEKAKKLLKWALESTAKQRVREKAALAFRTEQWDQDAINARDGMDGTQPKRPRLSIPKFLQPLNLVRNQFGNAHLGVNVHPLNEKSNKESAEVRQDMIRRIEQDSNAEYVEYWGYDRAVQAGQGAYRVVTVYDEDTEDELDQKLLIKRVYDQSLVVFDPSAQEPDKSDGKFAFVLSWVPADVFKEMFPAAKEDYESVDGWKSLNLAEPEWAKNVNDMRVVLVAEFFQKVEETLRKTPRVVTRTRVKIIKLTACEVLEETEWPGKYIPLIPTMADELQPVDGERRYQGLIEPAMDACRGYNYSVTTAIETGALSPRATPVGYEGQFEGHEAEWNTRTQRNWPYLQIKPVTLDGKTPAPFPQLMQADTAGVGMMTQLAQQMDGDIQAATGQPDQAMGMMRHGRQESGKAIQALQQQAYEGSSHFMRNMAQISIRLRGLILLDAMPYVYDRPGRVMQVLDAEMRPRPIMLGKPFTIDKATGFPVEAQEGDEGAKKYDLSEGRFGISVTVGKAFASRLQAGADKLTALLEARPELMAVFGDVWAGFLDVPYAEQLRKRVLKWIEQQNPGITKTDGEEATPEAMAAELQQKDAKLKELEGMLQQAAQAMETEQAKQQATLEKTQMDTASRERIASEANQMKLLIEQMQAQTALLLQAAEDRNAERDRENEREIAAAKLVVSTVDSAEERRFGAGEAERGRGHEANEAERSRQHGSGEAERDREHGAEQADVEREHSAEQAEKEREAAMSQGDGAGV